MNGWWKFHRAMYDHAIWSLPATHRVVWLTILGLASIKDAEWWDGTKRVQIPAGSLITSQDSLAEKSFTTRQCVRAAIANLIRLESISTKIATKKYTVINVINWPLYNGNGDEANQDSNLPATKDQPSANHIGRSKEGKTTSSASAEAVHSGNGHKKQPNPNVTLVKNAYVMAYADQFKDNPTWGAKEGALCVRLLYGRKPETVIVAAQDFIRDPLNITRDRMAYSFADFAIVVDRLIARRSERSRP